MRLSERLLMAGGRQPPDFLEFVGSATDGNYNNSASYTAPLPSHQAGDLLVVFLQIAATAAPTVTGGWTLRGALYHPSVGNTCRVYTKIAASSSEEFLSTLPTTYSWYRTSVALAFRSQTGRVPKFAWLDSASGVSSFPEVTPSAGLQKYTWLPCFAARRNTTPPGTLTMPSGYSTILGPSGGSTNAYGRLAVGRKSTQATSETPGAMVAVGSSVYHVTVTAAVWEED